jgi:hypothetical protein
MLKMSIKHHHTPQHMNEGTNTPLAINQFQHPCSIAIPMKSAHHTAHAFREVSKHITWRHSLGASAPKTPTKSAWKLQNIDLSCKPNKNQPFWKPPARSLVRFSRGRRPPLRMSLVQNPRDR